MSPFTFEPTLAAAQARLAAVDPRAYAATRNALGGAVTRLSPYITHGLLSLREVYDAVHARHPLHPQHKFVFELGWRAYWRHVWAHEGHDIHQSLHEGLLPEGEYQTHMPFDVLGACTGIPVVDLTVRDLYDTGYLHNHARMWLASYLVHMRKVHWHTGAQWMLGHLLDGDVASNHLSWQWVAGTGSSKPYLFNAENVAKYAPEPYHSPGTVIDTSYETLDQIARSTTPARQRGRNALASPAVEPPQLLTSPPGTAWSEPDSALASGRDVWLLHPWSIAAMPKNADGPSVLIGAALAECHAETPWSERRWRFVTTGLQARTQHLWWGNAAQMAQALTGARSVRWQPDPHADAALEQVAAMLQVRPAAPSVLPQAEAPLFEPVERYCKSFSQWWRQTKLLD
ncbi:MAG: deoxyribodipyrimidine photolyase [Bdellovibrionales bacterium]|nr:deoxyribodipyrimidine photolyase [Ramlibacter sp.]